MILALDLGARTGWAMNPDGVIRSGYEDLTDGNDPQPAWRFINLNRFLCDLHERTPIDRIVYEAPHMRGWPATFSLVGLAATVEEFAAWHDIPRPTRVHSASIKKHATGNGRATKDEVIASVQRRLGAQVEDDNEADALALLFYAIEKEGE